MRKIYAVYSTINLQPEPKWLQDFRAVYDKPYEFHLTLKQSAYIEEEQLPAINQRIAKIVAGHAIDREARKLTFDKLVLDEHDDFDQKSWIYLFCSERTVAIDSLQQNIREQLQAYSDYVNPASYQYEHDFNPHITIGRELEDSQYAAALKELPEDITCTGEIHELIVSCVPETNPVEANKPSNLNVYKL